MPQALTWNIGTTISATSLPDRAKPPGVQDVSECNTDERCEYTTPLGLPVVPEV
ncbi:hypothetical protein D3C76_1246520 [compost metagenome]